MNEKQPSNKAAWVFVNLIGGAAVIGSYIFGFLSSPEASTALWGGVPTGLRPVYTAGMVLAAIGYLVVFAYFLRMDEQELQAGSRSGFSRLTGLYLLILIPSALWMPLSLWALERSSQVLAWLVRLDLILVGAGAIGVLLVLVNARLQRSTLFQTLALIGSATVCLQTVVLDAVIWGSLFHV